MSADNWTACPKCLKAGEDKADKMDSVARASYGLVTVEAYRELVDEAYEFRKSIREPNETLREDWEIGIRNGVFEIRYSAGCNECSFRHQFKHEEKVA